MLYLSKSPHCTLGAFTHNLFVLHGISIPLPHGLNKMSRPRPLHSTMSLPVRTVRSNMKTVMTLLHTPYIGHRSSRRTSVLEIHMPYGTYGHTNHRMGNRVSVSLLGMTWHQQGLSAISLQDLLVRKEGDGSVVQKSQCLGDLHHKLRVKQTYSNCMTHKYDTCEE